MSVFTGANAVEDGLVLSVDAANIRSYDRYENLIINSESINSWGNNGDAVLVTANAATAPDGTLTADTLAQTAVAGANRWVSSTTLTYTAGVTYTLSIWLKKVSGTDTQPSIALWVNTGTNQSVGTITTEWVRYSASFTPVSTISSDTFTGLDIGWNTNGAANNFVFAAWGFQVERSATASEYYATTSTAKNRGTTWSNLISSSFNGTLTNDPTYNSTNNGKIVLDGTNDYIPITMSGNNSVRCYNSTIMFIVDLPVVSGGQRCIFSYRSGNGGQLYVGKSSSAIFSYYNDLNTPNYTIGTISANIPFIGTIVCDATNTTLKHYVNDSLSGSVTRTGWSSTYNTVLNLGYDAGGTNEYMIGNFYSFFHYNKVLSDAEIAQNYYALRGRYGL